MHNFYKVCCRKEVQNFAYKITLGAWEVHASISKVPALTLFMLFLDITSWSPQFSQINVILTRILKNWMQCYSLCLSLLHIVKNWLVFWTDLKTKIVTTITFLCNLNQLQNIFLVLGITRQNAFDERAIAQLTHVLRTPRNWFRHQQNEPFSFWTHNSA